MLTKDDRWLLVNCFLKEKGLVRQHLDSYNDFTARGLQEVIDEQSVIETDLPGLAVKLGEVEVGKPTVREAEAYEELIYPREARLRNLTYASSIYLHTALVEDGYPKSLASSKVFIGRLPVMVKSNLCYLFQASEERLIELGEDPKDPGGYFIVNGSEKVVVAQEDLAPNKVFVDLGGKGMASTHLAKVFSATPGFRVPIVIERLHDGSLHVSFPSVPGRLPLVVVMRALGLKTDKQIVEAISLDTTIQRELIPSIEVASSIMEVQDALDYVGSRVAVGQTREFRIHRAEQVLDKYFLPHLGFKPEDRLEKAFFLGQMAEKLLELVVGYREPDDKDHYANKRLKLAGESLTTLFRAVFKRFCRDVKFQLERARSRHRKVSLEAIIRADVITEGLRHALATGSWGGRAGASQLLDRVNYISTLSHLRRVVSPLSRSQPHFEARDLHPTQWGRLCPNETPEGPNCGLVKNLALMARISVGVREKGVEELLLSMGVIPVNVARRQGVQGAKIILNGRLIGFHEEPGFLVSEIKGKRRRGELSPEVNVAYHHGEKVEEVYVNCDAGRILRPLLVVEDGELKLKPEHIEGLRSGRIGWSDLEGEGVVEYLDGDEEEEAYIAINPEEATREHTHVEIAPATMFGVCTSLIPYAEHNHSPRNSYEAAMAKQALGFYTSNFTQRMDSRAHLLHYPQKPLTTTSMINIIGYDERPAGQNFIVAVLSYSGYNIEDAVILNKASIERGIGHSTFMRCYEAEERKYPGGQEDRIEIPEPTVRGYRASEVYSKLGEDGIIEPETSVLGGDVLIGRTSPPRFMEEYKEFEAISPVRRETSATMRHGESGIVDSVMMTGTIDGNKLIKIKVRSPRIPEIGDKFASRHGQKGVVGFIIPQEDAPFTGDGLVPDLIINPHAFPSRMTLGQLLESIAGKAAAMDGRSADGTPFSNEKEDDVRRLLLRYGFKPNGSEVLYDGRTGEMYKAEVFIGIVYYQKLHHMVTDKMHARARGPVQILTRQPTEGRAREGGLRFGEMERDCLIGHGAALLLKERLVDESDRCIVYICENCGLIGYYDRKGDSPRYLCPLCAEKAKVSSVTVSYAFKLLIQELMSFGVAPRIRLAETIR